VKTERGLLEVIRERRGDEAVPVLEALSQAGDPVCSVCAIENGGHWTKFGTHIPFSEGACTLCGQTKPVAAADNWQWVSIGEAAEAVLEKLSR
jgi:hypothetical protein